MKLWVDDVRPAPRGYVRCYSVNEAKDTIKNFELDCKRMQKRINIAYRDGRIGYAEELEKDYNLYYRHLEVIDIDHDAGEYASDGGDYIKLLDWLEETGRNYPIRIHSMNPVGIENMRRIIQKNDWKEVK